TALEREVRSYRGGEGRAAEERLKEPLDKTLTRLHGFLVHPQFERLPTELQEFVRRALQEVKDYQAYRDRLDETVKDLGDPEFQRSGEGLARLKDALEKLPLPAEYRDEWQRTPAAQVRAEWLKEIDAIGHAVERVRAGYKKAIEEGRRVLDTAAAANLPARAKEVLERAATLPDPRRDAKKPLPEAERLTYATVFNFSSVEQLVRTWE